MTTVKADHPARAAVNGRIPASAPVSVAALALAACMSPMPPLNPAATPAPSVLTAGAPQVASPLSYGRVTSQVEKGKTTQFELLQPATSQPLRRTSVIRQPAL